MSRSTADPLRLWRSRQRAVIALGAFWVLGVIAWSMWPLPQRSIAAPSLDPRIDSIEDSALPPLNQQAFLAPIWNPIPEPTPVEAAPPPARPEPIRFTLVGIVRDVGDDGEQVLRAALYDPTTDKMHVVASGERVGSFEVQVEATAVVLTDGSRTHRLQLRDDGGLRG